MDLARALAISRWLISGASHHGWSNSASTTSAATTARPRPATRARGHSAPSSRAAIVAPASASGRSMARRPTASAAHARHLPRSRQGPNRRTDDDCFHRSRRPADGRARGSEQPHAPNAPASDCHADRRRPSPAARLGRAPTRISAGPSARAARTERPAADDARRLGHPARPERRDATSTRTTKTNGATSRSRRSTKAIRSGRSARPSARPSPAPMPRRRADARAKPLTLLHQRPARRGARLAAEAGSIADAITTARPQAARFAFADQRPSPAWPTRSSSPRSFAPAPPTPRRIARRRTCESRGSSSAARSGRRRCPAPDAALASSSGVTFSVFAGLDALRRQGMDRRVNLSA